MMFRHFPRVAVLFFGLGLIVPSLAAQAPPSKPSAPLPGEAMIADYFRKQVDEIAEQCLPGTITREAWTQRRPRARKEFLEMMGLDPLPPRTDLKPKITGKVEGEGFLVEKVHFQSFPGLYVTANLYLPQVHDPKVKLPTILYVCGHGNVVEKGVSFGSKVKYQYHPAWFATHGYACLILDTLQLSEIPGLHHGTYREGMWWWQARGYTPGGVELWNAMRALDYLETRPEVDAKRIGVTGRSGGGATSWWILAGDERPVCFAPIAGIADLQAHLCEGVVPRFKTGVIAGHCDCMFMVNKYRWDFAEVAALAAPRPLLLGNSDVDDIFPVAGYRRIADKVRKVYAAYSAEDKFQLLETKGPHADTPELRIGINKWMNRWLKNDTTTPVQDDLPPALTPQQLKVLETIPEDAINPQLQDVFIKPVVLTLPESAEVAKSWWPKRSAELVRQLQEHCFAGWPVNPSAIRLPAPTSETILGDYRVQKYPYSPQAGITLNLTLILPKTAKPTKLMYRVLDESQAAEWATVKTAEALKTFAEPESAVVLIAPRGIGDSRWATPGSSTDIQHRRRFALLGQTLDGMRVWDVRRAIQAVQAFPEYQKLPSGITGHGVMAEVALYAGIFEPSVGRLDLLDLHPSHESPGAAVFLNVSKVLDLPQALLLTGDRPVRVTLGPASKASDFAWTIKLQKLLGRTNVTFH